jgi:hypothetical protein
MDTHAQQMFGHWLLAHTEEAAGRVGIEHAKLHLRVPPQPRDSCVYPRAMCRARIASKSRSVTRSPFNRKKLSSIRSRTCATGPQVPSGVSSTAYSIFRPNAEPSPKKVWIRWRRWLTARQTRWAPCALNWRDNSSRQGRRVDLEHFHRSLPAIISSSLSINLRLPVEGLHSCPASTGCRFFQNGRCSVESCILWCGGRRLSGNI